MKLHSAFLSVLCLVTFAAVIHSQTKPTFEFHSSTAAPFSIPASSNQFVPTASAIDVNNDGVQDIVQITPLASGGTAFAVEIANGDGTFKASSCSVTVDSSSPVSEVASEDFNNDGNVDLAFTVQNTNKLVIFLGNGNGTFQSPRTLALPMPQGDDVFVHQTLVAADFNGDGNVDLAAETQFSAGNEIIVYPGDGHGSFTAPVSIWMQGDESPNPQLMVGNFNGDKKADLAFTTQSAAFGPCISAGCPSQLVVLLGNGDLTFQQVLPMNAFQGAFPFGVGDLNRDGKTDIFGIDIASGELDVLLGTASGDITLASQSPAPNVYSYGPLYTADFNGDVQPEVVLSATSTPGTVQNGFAPPDQLFLFVGQQRPNPSIFNFTEIKQTVGGSDILSNVMLGRFNSNVKPDLAVLGESSSATTPVLLEGTNTTSSGFWGECNYPAAGEAIAVCTPQFSNNNVIFNVAANSFGLPRTIEVWVDGKKQGDNNIAWGNHTWANWDALLPAGPHTAAFIRSDVDNLNQEQKITFTVPENCYGPPSWLGVAICSPASNGNTSSPVEVSAGAHITGTIARMEVWVNGKKVYSEAGNTSLGYFINLPASSTKYRFVVIAVNTAGQQWSQAADAYVQ